MSPTSSYKIQLWAPNFSHQDGGIQQFSRLLHQALKKSPFVSSLQLVPLRPLFFGKIRFLLHALFFLLVQRPDFLLITHLHLARLSPLLRFFKIPYAVFCHGIECWNLSSTRDRHALAHAAHILAVSRYTLARLRSQLPACNAQFSLFPDHIETPPALHSSKNDARLKLQLPPEATILLTVSRLSSSERYKGHREIIQLLPQLIKTNPNILYHIVGDGDDRQSLENEVSRLKLEDVVHFSGRLSPENLELAYAACDAFVMPSTGEGFGIVYLEALVRGRPVLAGNVDGSVDPLLDGKLGLLADPRNPEELLEKFECLLHENPFPNPDYLKQEALAHFGPEKLQLRTDILIHSYLFPQTNKPENF